MRISTAGLYQSLLVGAMRTQSDYAAASMQESSGLTGTSFADYGSSSQRLLNLQAEIDSTTTWNANAKVAGDRTQTMYSAVGNMVDILTSLKTKISSAMSSSDNSALNSTGVDYERDLAAEMNTQSGGRYVFAGSATDTQPVDLTSYPATSPPSASTADTSYYKGDATKAAVRVGASESISYGVTGDSSAMEKALRAAAMVATVTTSPSLDTATLQSAYSLATTALTELSNLQAGISTVSSRLSTKETELGTTLTVVGNTLDDVKNIDTSVAALKVSSTKNQLQASYSALAGVMKVKLTDYL